MILFYFRFLAILSCLILSVLATIEELNEEFITRTVLYIVSIERKLCYCHMPFFGACTLDFLHFINKFAITSIDALCSSNIG